MKTQIFKNYQDFLSREDKELNGVSEQFSINNPEFEKQNETNKSCWNCSDCSDCSGCSDLVNASPIEIQSNNYPKIENIHNKLLEAVISNRLKMDSWHDDKSMKDGAYCGTTHCRAGWIVTLAGKEGFELEKKTSTLHAAMQIYHTSSPDIRVSPTRFFESNEKAMEDIKRCAKLESENNTNK